MIDLHVHSTFSDGSLTPEELVAEAEQVGLYAIALTDHDSTNGISSFLAAAKGKSLQCIPGVEISCAVETGGMHILGYYVNQHDDGFESVLARIRNGRDVRNQRILEKLNQAGVRLVLADVTKHAGDEVVGRPHIAQALMAGGYVTSIKEAFNVYLAKGRIAYEDRYRLGPREGIQLIRDAGGIPVLAHPATLQLKMARLRTLVAELTEGGLGGIEVYYPEHDANRVKDYLLLAEEHNLLATGGSDFHGSAVSNAALGRGFGSLNVPDNLADNLSEAVSKK